MPLAKASTSSNLMRDLILHIGRHKTGTTAIQHFLGDNRPALKTHGYLVPQSGKVSVGHHGFSRAIASTKMAKFSFSGPSQLPAFKQLARELQDEEPALTAVISSEAFQNCTPKIVSRAFRDYRPRIVVYLRNQLDYLASAYVQRVHATDYSGSIEDFYRDIYVNGSNYFSFLGAWSAQFPEGFCVRRYSASDIVADFCGAALGLSDDDFDVRQSVSNPSLNSRVALFKREINRRDIEIDKIYFLLPQLNNYFPGNAFCIPETVKEALVTRCQPSDEATAIAYFGDTVLFDYSDYVTGAEEALSDDEFHQMYAVLETLLEERRAASKASSSRTPTNET